VEQVINVIVGLSTAFIGYLIGRTWQRAVDWLQHRRLRQFLAPLLDDGVQIIVSRFMRSDFPEPTGLVGGGDALALREITMIFDKVGFKNYKTLYVDERELDRRGNLIVLGGMDTNRVTKEAVELINPGILLHDPGPGIKMEVHDLRPNGQSRSRHSTRKDAPCRYKATDDIDYGVIIRAPNPFNPSKGLIIVAGAYGYGSWAGAALIGNKSFLKKCEELESALGVSPHRTHRVFLRTMLLRLRGIVSRETTAVPWSPLECMFRVRIYDDRPVTPEILVFRSLP
jgi:hypothetical protein